MTSASSLDTFFPSITLKPGVAGTLRAAAAAAAERRVTLGVDNGVDLMLEKHVSKGITMYGHEEDLLGRHGCVKRREEKIVVLAALRLRGGPRFRLVKNAY